MTTNRVFGTTAAAAEPSPPVLASPPLSAAVAEAEAEAEVEAEAEAETAVALRGVCGGHVTSGIAFAMARTHSRRTCVWIGCVSQ